LILIAQKSIPEAAAALESIEKYYKIYADNSADEFSEGLKTKGKEYLKKITLMRSTVLLFEKS
jgi:cytochrome c peroxidase